MTEPELTPYVGFARKWRPRIFSDLVGQETVRQALSAEVRKVRISHAMLFTGPRGIGKTSAARILAKAINCENAPAAEPCGECRHCREIGAGGALDVIEIDGASNNGVDQVRDLREHVSHMPFACKYKIYIIDEVHMLTIQAFNALLKTLEEPPEFVIFILATTEPEKIPETIRSRCQVFRFRAITVEDIVKRLDYVARQEGADIEDDDRMAIMETIALAAEGGMRDALVALDQVISLADGKLTLPVVRDFLGVADQAALFDMIEAVRDGDAPAVLERVRDLAERGRDLERFAKQMLATLRDLMVLHCGGGDELIRLSAASIKRARTLSASLDVSMIVNAINIFLDLESRMKSGAQTRILLEFALTRLTAFDGLRPIADLIERLESGEGGPGARPQGPSGAPSPSSQKAPAPAPGRGPIRSFMQPQAPPSGHPPARMTAEGAQAVPLREGGVLETVDVSDIETLRGMLTQAVASSDRMLGSTLAQIPLDRIEGNTAWFGRPGQPISQFDAIRFERAESRDALREKLAELTGARDLMIRLQGRVVLGGAAPPPSAKVEDVPVAPRLSRGSAAPPPQTRGASPLTPLEPVEFDSGPPIAGAMDADPDSADEASEAPVSDAGAAIYEVTPEQVRQAFGLAGLSAARIRKLMEENPALREKVELAREIFNGVVKDGDGNPVRL